MYNSDTDLLLISNHIFTGLEEKPEKGYIAIKDNKILWLTAKSYIKTISYVIRIE